MRGFILLVSEGISDRLFVHNVSSDEPFVIPTKAQNPCSVTNVVNILKRVKGKAEHPALPFCLKINERLLFVTVNYFCYIFCLPHT